MGAVSFRPAKDHVSFRGREISYVAGDMFGDLDGDKHLDLVIVSGETDSIAGQARVRILRGDGKGAFKENSSSSLPILAEPRFVRLADVNGDLRLDIVISHGSDQLSVLLNGGNDRFTPATGFLTISMRRRLR